MRRIVSSFTHADGPVHHDLTHHTDSSGYDNLMIVGYWFDQRNTASTEPMKDVPYGADALLRMNRRMYC